MRKFESGATRDNTEGKYDFEGFLSPLVLNRYAEYMNKHRTQADGKLRDSDNWQKGIPLAAYIKSAYRHFFDWWANHRGVKSVVKEDIEESLCALLFNTMGYLHEHLKSKAVPGSTPEPEVYVPQPGDTVFIELRDGTTDDSVSDHIRRVVENGNHIGFYLESMITDPDYSMDHKISVGTEVFYVFDDELTVLKRKGGAS